MTERLREIAEAKTGHATVTIPRPVFRALVRVAEKAQAAMDWNDRPIDQLEKGAAVTGRLLELDIRDSLAALSDVLGEAKEP